MMIMRRTLYAGVEHMIIIIMLMRRILTYIQVQVLIMRMIMMLMRRILSYS